MTELVNYEIAKLLKEKGLKLNFCREVFYENPNTKGEFIRIEVTHDWELIEDRDWYSAPTIAQVIMWLYEKHGIWIIPSYECKSETFFKKEWFWIAIRDGEEIAYQYKDFKSPTEAYLSAINHVLSNLI